MRRLATGSVLAELAATVAHERGEHETFMDTVERLLITMMHDEGFKQVDIGRVLHTSSRAINYKMGNLQLRPRDRRNGASA